jgi:radical SAM superfamily enzyme YgiQ (UPF0313 family)
MILKKVLLIYPPDSPKTLSNGAINRMEPLALEYVAACFPASEVSIRDLRIEPDLIKHLKEIKPALVGITGYTCHANTMLLLASEIKKYDPAIIVMAGGIHASIRPQDFDVPEIDYVVIGEGTSVISEWLLNKGDPQGIAGLAYRWHGQLIYNPPRVYPELGTLPMPRRDLVNKYRKKYILDGSSDFSVVRTSLGCPFRCTFCCLWGLTGGRYLKRPIEDVIADLKAIPQKMIFFADDESMIDDLRMMELAQRIKEEKIVKKYYLYARADTITNHPELFRAWKDIGLKTVVVGYEAASNERLQYLNKQTTIEAQAKATVILNEIDVKIDAQFILDPEFTKNDFITLKNYIRQKKIWRAGFCVLTPVPGTELYNQRKGELITNDWDYFDGYYALFPTKLPLEEFYNMYSWLESEATPYRQKIADLLRKPLTVVVSILLSVASVRIQRYLQVKRGIVPKKSSR